ncbi:MAG: hypothetical protein WCE33_10125 [Nitrososphaeraceae archaeon]
MSFEIIQELYQDNRVTNNQMTDSDEQKIHEEDIKRKQMDKEMREKRGHREEYNTKVISDPAGRLLHDLARDIREMQNRLTNIESILYKLLESKGKDL